MAKDYVDQHIVPKRYLDRFGVKDGKRYIVFLYITDQYSGELKGSAEGEVFWYPLKELFSSDQLVDGFREMLEVFTRDDVTEVFYASTADDMDTVFC